MKIVRRFKVFVVPLALLDTAAKVNVLVGLTGTNAGIGLARRVFGPLQRVLQNGILSGIRIVELGAEYLRPNDGGLADADCVECGAI